MRRVCSLLYLAYVIACISIQIYFNIDIFPLVLYLFACTRNFFSTDSISTALNWLSLFDFIEHRLCHNASLLLDMDE